MTNVEDAKLKAFERAAIESGIPEHTAGGLARYEVLGIPPGDFLQAVLKNDLLRALRFADSQNLNALPAIVNFATTHITRGDAS